MRSGLPDGLLLLSIYIRGSIQYLYYSALGLPRCCEVGFIQRLYIISKAVRSGLPGGLLLLLLPRHLSMSMVVRWGIPRFMMGIWYGTLLVSE